LDVVAATEVRPQDDPLRRVVDLVSGETMQGGEAVGIGGQEVINGGAGGARRIVAGDGDLVAAHPGLAEIAALDGKGFEAEMADEVVGVRHGSVFRRWWSIQT
jgi:hypothetical protein